MSNQTEIIRNLLNDLSEAKQKIAGLEAELRATRSFWKAEKAEVERLRENQQPTNAYSGIYAPGTK